MTELDAIPVFVKVAQMGSFTKAARVLGMPNTTVSAKVAQLERSLGTTLMQRTTRKLHLTEAGQAYLDRCLKALSELEAGEFEIASTSGKIKGVLRVTSSVDVGQSLLPRIIDQYLKTHPHVEFDLIVTNRLVDLVGEGVDIAIRAGRLKDSSLIAKKFVKSRFGLYASKTYLKNLRTLSIKSLETESQFIKFTPFAKEGIEFVNGAQSIRVRPQGCIQCDDLGTVRAMAMMGHGIAVLLDFMVDPALEEGSLVAVLPDWKMKTGFFSLVYPSQRFVSPKVRAFIETAEQFLIASCEEEKKTRKKKTGKN